MCVFFSAASYSINWFRYETVFGLIFNAIRKLLPSKMKTTSNSNTHHLRNTVAANSVEWVWRWHPLDAEACFLKPYEWIERNAWWPIHFWWIKKSWNIGKHALKTYIHTYERCTLVKCISIHTFYAKNPYYYVLHLLHTESKSK